MIMSFTFPVDSNSKTGTVKPTLDGNDFYVPSREQGSDTLKGALSNVPTAGTRVRMPDYKCREVTIIALEENTGTIFIGGGDVSSTVYGAKLKARDSITLKVSNTNLIYINSSVSGEGISYVAI
jgi:hypothetical protein